MTSETDPQPHNPPGQRPPPAPPGWPTVPGPARPGRDLELPVNEPIEDLAGPAPHRTRRSAAAPTQAGPAAPGRRRGRAGRLLAVVLWAAFFLLQGVVIVLAYGYWSIARDLPPIGDLRERASQVETAAIYDARGNLLSDIIDPQSGRRRRVALSEVAPELIAATLATEDSNFYQHPGFDPAGIVRAIWQNVLAGDTVSGASTITQQLVRALVFSPEQAAERTSLRKIREIILAAEITRRYSKDEILELYLNEIYYGNRAYGIEAAAETYFNKPARDLTLGEAAMLAGLPQAPAIYDIYTRPQAVFDRQRDVLTLMLALSQERGCIPVPVGGRPAEPVCVTADDLAGALAELRTRTFTPPRTAARFPHWVNYVRQLVEARFGAQALYRSGYVIETTLEPDLQVLAERAVSEQVAALAGRNVTNGALVAVRPATGAIVALVGSRDYGDPVDGQINMALVPRQPGSSIKPLTFALAFERGWNPATLLWDVPTEFPDGARPPYVPVNYDGKFHGPVPVRAALANSYNIPAVQALQFVGLYGTPNGDGLVEPASGLIPFLQSLGVTTLVRRDYGLALALGGGEVPLVEMVGAYGALADGGRRVFPVALRRVTDLSGHVVCQQPDSPGGRPDDPPPCQEPPANWGQALMSPDTAYLISDILADNEARTPAFGPDSPLRLSFPAAVKTGTTNDYRDNWTIGYTPDLVAGVWVGNADYTPMVRTSGVSGAAPIWRAFMEQALAGRATPFTRPDDVVELEVCALSGAVPSAQCPADQRRRERFAPGRLPPPPERDLWQTAYVDPFTGLRQTAECAQAYQTDRLYAQERPVIGVTNPFAQTWLQQDPNGQAWAQRLGLPAPLVWAPQRDCTLADPRPLVQITSPLEGATIAPGLVQIVGLAGATDGFDHYRVEYGLSHDPGGWGEVLGDQLAPVQSVGRLADWDASGLPDGPVTVRVVVFSRAGGSAEYRTRFTVQRPTATAAPTTASTATPNATLTATPAPTSSATPTSPPASATPASTETAAATDVPAPSDTPLPYP